MRIVLVGGAGSMGRITARDLATFWPDAEIVLADYDEKKARELARELAPAKARAVFTDITSANSLAKALRGAFCVLNSAPYRWNLDVMEAALSAGAHYVDLGGLFHMTRKQLALDGKFRKAGKLALLGMGAAPGITNLLAALGAARLDEIREIHVRLGSRDLSRYSDVPALPVSYSLQTILEEFSLPPAVFTRGDFRFVEPMSGGDPHRFPPPVGLRRPFHTLHSEVATLPLSFADRGVREVTFKIAFDDEFVDRVRFLRDLGFASAVPLRLGGCEVRPIEVANRLAMSQRPAKRNGPLRQHEVVRTILKGKRARERRTLVLDCHASGMPKWNLGTDINTGCPPAIAAQMLAAGEITATGAVAPEVAVPAEPFFTRLSKRRMAVRVAERKGWAYPV